MKKENSEIGKKLITDRLDHCIILKIVGFHMIVIEILQHLQRKAVNVY